jgi:hypothetical protein
MDDEARLPIEDDMGLWENQGGPRLKASELRAALLYAIEWADLPVEVEYYDGMTTRRLQPMRLDLRVDDAHLQAVVLTVT